MCEEDIPGDNVHEGAVGEEARDREWARRRSESIHKETTSARAARRELAGGKRRREWVDRKWVSA